LPCAIARPTMQMTDAMYHRWGMSRTWQSCGRGTHDL
jgi:hypothetical protein